MKKNLLVTLADKNYIEQAKQLFSSVYWNAGWKGDYMLLAHEIPEKKLKWFREKGILVKKCKPLEKSFKAVKLSKFYLFTPYFKKWKNIVYLDADIIVRASLDELTKRNGFAVAGWKELSKMFVKPFLAKIKKTDKTLKKLKENYNLREKGFSTGVMAFSTNIIRKDTFYKLKNLFKTHKEIHYNLVEQPVYNLLFYKKWTKLPYLYNCWPDYMIYSCNIKPKKIRGIVLHFMARDKPWLPKNPFYNEWKTNLEKAELIDLKQIPPPREIWTKQEMQRVEDNLEKSYSRFRYIFWKISILIDKNLGLFGIFLKNNFPKLYFKLKEEKGKIKK